MMDFYSNYPGPSKNEAIRAFKGSFKENKLAEINPPQRLRENVARIIDESISDGILGMKPGVDPNKDSVFGSQTGWAVFGKKDCEDTILPILNERIRAFKASHRDKGNLKTAFAKMEGVPGLPGESNLKRRISSYLGGKRRTRRRRKRKSKKKKTRKKRKTRRLRRKSRKK